MLIMLGNRIIAINNISAIILNWFDEDNQETGVAIEMTNSSTLFFWGKEAEIVRWYFNHPMSQVVDIKNLSGM